MKLAHILVCHTVDPTKAIESIPHEPGALWYVFLHSDDAEIERKVSALMAARGGNVFAYKTNRGLARSWNDGMHLAMEAECEAVLFLNDDLFFYPEGYDAFLHTITSLRSISRNVAFATVNGLESGASPHAGKVLAQDFACCAVMRESVERVGYFDEAFTPAYFEDIDYAHRTALAGMTIHVDQRALVEHERSSTMRAFSAEARRQADDDFARNHAYFHRKWRANEACTPSFATPFNDPDASYSIPFNKRAAGLV